MKYAADFMVLSRLRVGVAGEGERLGGHLLLGTHAFVALR